MDNIIDFYDINWKQVEKMIKTLEPELFNGLEPKLSYRDKRFFLKNDHIGLASEFDSIWVRIVDECLKIEVDHWFSYAIPIPPNDSKNELRANLIIRCMKNIISQETDSTYKSDIDVNFSSRTLDGVDDYITFDIDISNKFYLAPIVPIEARIVNTIRDLEYDRLITPCQNIDTRIKKEVIIYKENGETIINFDELHSEQYNKNNELLSSTL